MTKTSVHLALIGDHDAQIAAHQAIPVALKMAGDALDLNVRFDWLATDTLQSTQALQHYDGFWCTPGSPYRDLDGALLAIRFAREQRRPYLGTCAGFQHAILEYARNVLGWADAEHGELAPDAPRAVIAPLACGLVEAVGSIRLTEFTRIAQAYGTLETEERYRCRYGINPQFERALLDGGDLIATGHDSEGDLRSVELLDHPFFVATLFQPERAALEGLVPALALAFVKACA